MDSLSTEQVRLQLKLLGYDGVDDDVLNLYVEKLQQFHVATKNQMYVENPLLESNVENEELEHEQEAFEENDTTQEILQISKLDEDEESEEFEIKESEEEEIEIDSHKSNVENEESDEDHQQIMDLLNTCSLQEQYNDAAKLIETDLNIHNQADPSMSVVSSIDERRNVERFNMPADDTELSGLQLSTISSNYHIQNDESFLSQTDEMLSEIIQVGNHQNNEDNIRERELSRSNSKYYKTHSHNNSNVKKKRRKKKGFKSSDPVALFQKFNRSWKKDRFLNKKTTKQSQSSHALSNRTNAFHSNK